MSAAPASADDDAVTPRVELRHRLWVDLGVTAGVTAGIVVWRLVRADVLPATCRLCDGQPVNGVDDAFRSAFIRPETQPAVTAGDIVSFVAAPAVALGLTVGAAAADRRGDEILTDVVLVTEATISAVALSEGLRAVTLRERPYIHAMEGDAKAAAIRSDENALLSLPDGHTTTTFAIAAAVGTVTTMRGYRMAPVTWIAGGLLALASGYLHLAGDRHYFTDVIAGAALGTGVGIGVPLLFHRPAAGSSTTAPTLATAPVPGGHVVSLHWGF